MTDILEIIANNKRKELDSFYNCKTGERLVKAVVDRDRINTDRRSMRNAILDCSSRNMPGIIAEFKRRSPSKGEIAPMADVVPVVTDYEKGGAAACSVLTDTRFFGGSLNDLAVARNCCNLPLLRKDFIIDEIQVFEASYYRADAILLIASLLDQIQLHDFTLLAHELGLEVLYEIHDLAELDKMPSEVDLLGINNRRLATFDTDVKYALSLRDCLPHDIVRVAESGIQTSGDIKSLREAGFKGFLIGESLMRCDNKLRLLRELA